MAAPCTFLTTEERKVYTDAAEIIFNAGAKDFVNFRRAMIEQFGRDFSPFAKEVYSNLRKRKSVNVAEMTADEAVNEVLKQLELSQAIGGQATYDDLKRIIDGFNAAGLDKKAIAPTTMDKIIEWSVAMKLTGLGTQVKNIAGNTGMLLLRLPEKAAGGIYDRFRATFTGMDRTVRSREALAEAVGIYNGFQRAGQRAMDVLVDPVKYMESSTKTGEVLRKSGAIGQGGKAGKALDKGLKKATKGKVGFDAGEVVRAPFRVLAAMDVFFKELNRSAEVYAQVARASMNNGKFGANLVSELAKIGRVSDNVLTNPAEFRALIETADESALIKVFQEELEGVTKTMNASINQHPALKLIVPFFKTPVNLFKQAMLRVPGGAFVLPSTYKKFIGKNAKYGLKSAEFAELIGQQMTGAAIFSSFAWMAAKGFLVGDGPKSQAQRRTLMATGWQPNTIKVPGTNVWVKYRGYEPFSSWMSTISNTYGSVKEGDRADQIASTLIFSYVKQFAENPFLTGINQLSEAVNYAGSGEDQLDYAANFVGTLAVNSTVPVILQQWGRIAFDPTLRKSKSPLKNIQARIPGASKGVEPVRDIFGQPVQRELRGIPQALGFDVAIRKTDKLSTVLRELKDKDGKPFAIGMPGRNVNGVQLSDEEYDRYVYLTGVMYKQAFDKYVNSEQFKDDNGDQRFKTMGKIKTKINEIVRNQEFSKYYQDKRERSRKRPQQYRTKQGIDKFIGEPTR